MNRDRPRTGRRALAPVGLLLLLLWGLAGPALAIEPVFIGAEGRRIELFVAQPDAAGRHPAILFVHGFQGGPNPPGGAEMTAGGDRNPLSGWARRRGYVAASISQPGFGRSAGPPDFCGPVTQAAVRAALAHLRALPSVDSGRIVLLGLSRGAIVSGMVAAEEPGLRAVILIAGLYDMGALRPHPNPGIEALIQAESGGSPEALAARSPLRVAGRIAMPVLLLHGRHDPVAPVAQAEAMAAALRARGTDVTLALFESGHSIPIRDRFAVIDPFLERVVGRGTGR
ncbi:alpha/beta hydrolase family protein [Salinarimonas soli]|uniref:Prolyl oligopeptidase family serine peptidase n=1 Tax=Salinarimonas soli TaxID=1638099 RepID=A0A5B2VDK9_9HYPH|nr:prolyl oligopeptidase family serine peptidase [Salinarimonas soli]KAA2236818.1 prolyl oligopeptidase family serine peptidase [Salinarimonas soli]